MLGKTHVAMGMAVSLAVIRPQTPQGCVVALAGGALGGVVADIDILDNDYKFDALIGQAMAIGIAAIAFGFDFWLKLGNCQSVIDKNKIITIAGIILYVILLIIGFMSDHRTFTHSLLALVLFSVAAALIYPKIVLPYALGYLTHLLLDILNKKKVPLLYPKEGGICFGWCYSDKVADKIFMGIGFTVTLVLLIYFLISYR